MLKQNFNQITKYKNEEHEVWRDLMNKQLPLVKKYASHEYLRGLERLDLSLNSIPNVEEISTRIKYFSGWSLCPVEGLIPGRKFFKMLSEKTFPVVTRIRSRNEIDFYTDPAPDVFHELFGHCPLLTNIEYANSMHSFAKQSLSCDDEQILYLAKLFWTTYEFGLVKTTDGIKIYGAGILPSNYEIKRVMHDECIKKEDLNMMTNIKASLHGNIPQSIYYVIDSLAWLYNISDFIEFTKANTTFEE